jgi:Mrp family chromosome partitioning ATPase
VGLSTLFRNIITMQAIIHPVKEVKNLAVITSGNLPANPSELLGSERMDKIITELIKFADVVILDSPPSIVADAQILAKKVDGVLFIIQPGKTHSGAVKSTFEQFNRGGVKILGIVFNRIPKNRGYYYGGHQHYDSNYYRGYHYYSDQDSNRGSKKNPPQTSHHPINPTSSQPRETRNSQNPLHPLSSRRDNKK